jgi:hypothetical protein
LLTRLAPIEDDSKQIKQQKIYQELIIQDHQRSLEDIGLKFNEQRVRLDVLEKEIFIKRRSSAAKKSAA